MKKLATSSNGFSNQLVHPSSASAFCTVLVLLEKLVDRLHRPKIRFTFSQFGVIKIAET